MAEFLVGDSPDIRALRRELQVVAGTGSTVLITGETGTGKGLVARLLHELSGASPFVHVDCASLSPSLIESELFGHERGSFTGASERRVGRLEQAGEGSLFLDELAELDPWLQSKLLRVLQDRVFERVGGAETQSLRARVMAATNRDLPQEIAAGRFRADLYSRLQVFEIRVPPLRDRRSDLPLLVDFLASRWGRRPRMAESFGSRLQAYDWPGNVRELANVLERLQITKPEGPWEASDLDGLLVGRPRRPVAQSPTGREGFLEYERASLEALLLQHRWNVSAAARSLGVSRGALRGRLSRVGF